MRNLETNCSSRSGKLVKRLIRGILVIAFLAGVSLIGLQESAADSRSTDANSPTEKAAELKPIPSGFIGMDILGNGSACGSTGTGWGGREI